jgi:hypothetical protein
LAQGASGYNVQCKNFHVEAKPMLEGEKILLYTELDGPTTTPAGLTATQTGQTTTSSGQTAAQAGSTAITQGVVTLRSQNQNMLKRIGGSRLLIICKIQTRRSTKIFGVLLSSLL